MRVNRHPLREVTDSMLREGSAGLVARSRITIRWWELTLSCGHVVERAAKYQPQDSERPLRGWARLHHPPGLDKVEDAPGKARCELCPIP